MAAIKSQKSKKNNFSKAVLQEEHFRDQSQKTKRINTSKIKNLPEVRLSASAAMSQMAQKKKILPGNWNGPCPFVN